MRDLFVGRLGIEYRTHGGFVVVSPDIPPVVFPIPWVLFGCILGIAAMAALDAIEIEPGLVFEPKGGRGAAAGMEGDEVVRILFLEGGTDGIPDILVIGALDVAPVHPDDIGFILITVSEEARIGLRLRGTWFRGLDYPTPHRYQCKIEPIGRSQVDDGIEVIPIGLSRCGQVLSTRAGWPYASASLMLWTSITWIRSKPFL